MMDEDADLKVEVKEDDYDDSSDESILDRKYQLQKAVKEKKKENGKLKTEQEDSDYEEEDDESYDCNKCSKTFQSKTGLLNHMRIHLVVKNYTCALCQEEFKTNLALIKHKEDHKNEDKIFVCNICKMAFTDHCDFLVHETTHTKQKLFKCIECSGYFNHHYIKTHIMSHFDKCTECPKCGKMIRNARYTNHVNSHDIVLECGECGKICAHPSSFKYHMLSHTGVKRFQCLYCGEGFANNAQLKVHTRHHTNERPFECDVCDKKFKQSTDWKRHKLTHEKKEKNIECDVCKKKYLHKESLAMHMKTHTKEGLVYCQFCNKGCQTRTCLKAHILFAHNDVKEFDCEICGVAFKTIRHRERHFRTKAHLRNEFAKKKGKEIVASRMGRKRDPKEE